MGIFRYKRDQGMIKYRRYCSHNFWKERLAPWVWSKALAKDALIEPGHFLLYWPRFLYVRVDD
jgi:hypothetical protein